MSEEKFVDNPDTAITLTDQDVDTAVSKYPFIVVDCWAEWCGPCKMMSPVIEGMAKKHKGDIVFAKLDVDKNPDTAKKYGIRSIPNLLIFKDGKKVGDIVGAMPEAKLLERINSFKG
ncbi:MAG TPA: thioredoxin [Desulfomonilia bacterium]|nr:thioredoxin [Desulfomonilia bacterium]